MCPWRPRRATATTPEWGKFNISEEGETVVKTPMGMRPAEELPGKGTHSF